MLANLCQNVFRSDSDYIRKVIRLDSDTQAMSLAECSECYQIIFRANSEECQKNVRTNSDTGAMSLAINVQNIIRMFSEDYQNIFTCSNDKFSI